MADKTHSFESYFKRAVSPIVVLGVLKDKPMYGYEISAAIKERSGGKYTVTIMYPILDGLMEEGYIKETETMVVEGRARKYYAITDKGLAYFTATVDEFTRLSDVFYQLTKGDSDHEKGDRSGH